MTLSLSKGEGISLKKTDGTNLSKIILGLGWDAAKKKSFFGGGSEIDLDASIILFDGNKNAIDTVFFGSTKSADGAIKHSGDNLTGAGDGDDEQIVVDLTAINRNTQYGVLVITSYSGQKFNEVKNVFARVIDASTPSAPELIRYDLAEGGAHTGSIVAKFERDGLGWKFTAIGNAANGKTPSQLVGDAKAAL